MLREPKLKTLNELIENATPEELIWINGYLSGLVRGSVPATETKPLVNKLTIVFGTDTGNSKKLASAFSMLAKKKGLRVKLQSLDHYRPEDIAREEYFFVIVSTHGDGDPPEAAKKFYTYIHGQSIGLEKLHFGVLALGDTAYPMFCKTGEDIDSRLNNLGGKRVLALQKCDTDYEQTASVWFESVLRILDSHSTTPASMPSPGQTSSRKNFRGTVISNVRLSGRKSLKRTHHLELSVPGVSYTPGDSIGIVPENQDELVNAILKEAGINGETAIAYRQKEDTLYDLLKRRINILYLPERVVKQYALVVGQEIPPTRIDLLNLLKIYPVKDASQFEEVIQILEPIIPRLYSISSSLQVHADEVHLTIAQSCFTINEVVTYGLCSNYLVNLKEGDSFDFYVHPNGSFRLPDGENDIIMIGPGTGIAPFRSFLEERDATGATGRSWLFFGDQHFESDFLYQTEIQQFAGNGVLTHVNVAFSRDQAEKIYVQKRIRECGEEFFQWMESGASVFLCGSMNPMSHDVEQTILGVIENFGSRSSDEAMAYLSTMKEEGRYLKDVY
jgi:sulfite reductase (NADPH) flavoprotein alpha-component